jgi:hypothetical protein
MTLEDNDPTSAGFAPPARDDVQLSCNEVEALCTKAARGAGLSWGIAEEAGFAARWLFARGIDGPGALLSHLERTDGDIPIATTETGDLRAGDSRTICPVAVGAALSDFAAVDGDHVHAGPLGQPVLILPFVHYIAHDAGTAMALDWSGGRVVVQPNGGVTGAVAALEVAGPVEISIEQAPADATSSFAPDRLVKTSAETIRRLDAFAMETTVPASAASRVDAGSAGSDND